VDHYIEIYLKKHKISINDINLYNEVGK
jgi:hypothetical protein